jgi:ankyrin repeat protein
LLDHGASLDIANKEGSTILSLAVLKGYVHVVRELLNRVASMDIPTKECSQPLLVAQKGQVEVVRELLIVALVWMFQIKKVAHLSL